MKTCKKCKIEKPESEYYNYTNSKDRLDSWCKACRLEENRRRDGTHKLARSTEEAVRLLAKQGIPTTSGFVGGRPGRDIVAYGYLTIEAKGTDTHGGNNGYLFGFTKSQKENPCDFYILLFRDVNRVFVIPGGSSLLEFDGTKLYLNITDPQLQRYENAYHLIKERVTSDIRLARPIDNIRISTYTKQYAL